ncbi:MAG: hypothetical protein FWE50_01430 [Alphaproteobacteria bacterium]|nr:hypothetical protein [Alphaproteobacteria bacterium]
MPNETTMKTDEISLGKGFSPSSPKPIFFIEGRKYRAQTNSSPAKLYETDKEAQKTFAAYENRVEVNVKLRKDVRSQDCVVRKK